MADEYEKTTYYGLGVSRVGTFNGTFFGPYYDDCQDRILVPEWPRKTQAVYIYPKDLRELYFRLKPTSIKQVSAFLADERYSGIFLAQVALSPSIDITEIAQGAFSSTLYRPDKLEKKDYGIRCWAMSAKVRIDLTSQDTYMRYEPLEKVQLENGVTAYVFDSTIVNPDLSLNREVSLANKQGVFTIEASNDTYPLPLNHYEVEIKWDDVKVVKQFDACQPQVRFLNTLRAIEQVDPQAAMAYQNWFQAKISNY